MMFALALAVASPVPSPTESTPSPVLIRFEAEDTLGKRVLLPDDRRGSPLVLVVGFTQGSAKGAAAWTDALEASVGSHATVVGVATLDRVPGFARGFVRHAIDKQIGPPATGKAGFVTTTDAAALRSAAPGGNEDDPVVFVFDATGARTLTLRAGFSSTAERTVETGLGL